VAASRDLLNIFNLARVERRDSSWRTGKRFLSTLEKLIRESPDPLSPWFLTLEIKMDNNLLPSLWFSEVTDEHVAKLIYLYVVRLSTDHRPFLGDIRTVNFLHSLVQLAVGSPQIDSRLGRNLHAIRFRWILSKCVRRWSIDQCAICCWILSQQPPLSTTGEDIVDVIRSSQALEIERKLIEACGRLYPSLPQLFACSFRRWLIAYTDVRLAEGMFAVCFECAYEGWF